MPPDGPAAPPLIPAPAQIGSYPAGDVTPLLTELSGDGLELPVEIRERMFAAGGHYAETLPIEYRPTAEYERLFETLLAAGAARLALLVRVLARRILEREPAPVLLSLARAGIPVGILLRRALALEGVDAPHYAISIVRDRGLDERAIRYAMQEHGPERLLFVDGWTGKGAIQRELVAALEALPFPHRIAPRLAVLADPAYVTDLFATRDDELIPSACLNSTVSGLMSRTVIRPDLLGPDAFHGVRVYREFAPFDRSLAFIETIAGRFGTGGEEAIAAGLGEARAAPGPDGRGLLEVQRVQAEEGIANVHHVKPGIGETTRVLLRRAPRAVLIDPQHTDRLAHVLMLAADRGVPVRERSGSIYACFGLIQSVD